MSTRREHCFVQVPPVLATGALSVSSTSYRGSWPGPGARATICPLTRGNG